MNASAPIDIIDIHTHHVPARWALATTQRGNAASRARWQGIAARIADENALVESMEDGDLAGRVVNIPSALFSDDGEAPSGDEFRRINDHLAEIVHHRRGLTGIASVNAFSGEEGARETHRAVTELGLRGVFVESGMGDLLLDAPQARPTLAAAAALGVPVFAHPVNPQPLTDRMAPYNRLGTLFARGEINAASLVALLESGVFEELPALKVIVTNLAIGAVLLAATFGSRSKEVLRRNVFIETMGFNSALIRACVDILGVDNVLVGSDWPIVSDGPIRHRVVAALSEAGLNEGELRRVAAGNARRLFGLKQ
jgi:aminocarboxymuconate-semialdehyde decarboxylase